MLVEDTIDLAILSQLALHGRITYSDLAEQIGLSGPAAADRVRRLEERGVITGYAARIAAESLGRGLTAYVAVSLSGSRQAFLTQLASMPEAVECHHVAGDDDYLVKVHVDGTRGLEAFVSERITSLPGVRRTRTTVVLSTPFERPLAPVPA